MHGYSLLRPTLNTDYFHDLYDQAEQFGIEVEGHREFLHSLARVKAQIMSSYLRYRDWTWCIRVCFGLYRLFTDGR